MRRADRQARRMSLRRGSGERGSALLIVLVMAAVIAILLYKELPVSAFEAQRRKEELTVARGNEYKHAIKLFVRKFGRFPNALSELESTNRMRFLRRKYVDPLTGKDDWRLLHAGAGGVILDSKVNNPNGKPGNALGAGATFGGFNNSIVQPDANAQAPAVASAAFRQRPPAVSNAGPSGAGVGNADGDFPPLPSTGEPAPGVGNAQGLYPADGTSPNSQNAPSAVSVLRSQSAAAAQPSTDPNLMANMPTDPSAAAAAGTSGIGAAGPGNSAVMQQLNSQNPVTQGVAGATAQSGSLQNTSAFPQNGTQNGALQNGTQQSAQSIAAGGIAGVASVAVGASIKTVNDQTKYPLWEFYYDLRKEQSGAAAGALQQNQANAGQNGANNSSSTSAFGFVGAQTSSGQMAPVNGNLPSAGQQPVATNPPQ